MIYPLNYGYIEGIMAPDGEEQDAYILGIQEPVQQFTGRIIAIVRRADDIDAVIRIDIPVKAVLICPVCQVFYSSSQKISGFFFHVKCSYK